MARTKNELELLEEGLRDFDRSLPMSLLKAREAVMREFLPSLRSHQLSPEQWRVIRALVQEDGLELAEISLRCFLLAPSLSRISKSETLLNARMSTVIKEDPNCFSQKKAESCLKHWHPSRSNST